MRYSRLRPLLAGATFVAYAVATLWMHGVHNSTFGLERVGGLVAAASYLYYGQPFGAVDGGLWKHVSERVGSSPTGEESADEFLRAASQKSIAAGSQMPTTIDGSGLGYPRFATAALYVFGPRTFSLALGFVIVLGTSVAAFLLRFRDDRALAIPILFAALTLMLLTPLGTVQFHINQAPTAGYRFFVIAGILPALHIILELFDGTMDRWQRIVPLLAVQTVILLMAISVRFSAIYFVGAIVLAAIATLWSGVRRPVMMKASALLIAGLAILIGARLLLTPASYLELGAVSDPPWHRAFVGLGIHPGWPFGQLITTIDCKPAQLSRGIGDINGHCAYLSAVREGAQPGPIYGAQYERLVRDAFLNVLRDYPQQAAETYAFYKPRSILRILSSAAALDISHRNVPVLIAVATQLAILVFMARLLAGETGRLPGVCTAFAIIGVFSLVPQLIAWSNIPTTPDLVCYMLAGILLLLFGVLRYGALRLGPIAVPTR